MALMFARYMRSTKLEMGLDTYGKYRSFLKPYSPKNSTRKKAVCNTDGGNHETVWAWSAQQPSAELGTGGVSRSMGNLSMG